MKELSRVQKWFKYEYADLALDFVKAKDIQGFRRNFKEEYDLFKDDFINKHCDVSDYAGGSLGEEEEPFGLKHTENQKLIALDFYKKYIEAILDEIAEIKEIEEEKDIDNEVRSIMDEDLYK